MFKTEYADLAAQSAYERSADDPIDAIVTALYQHVRGKALNERFRRVVFEYRDPIHSAQAGEDTRSVSGLRLGTALALETLHRRIVVDRDNEPIAKPRSLLQI